MVILNQSTNLRRDLGALPSHEKELAHGPSQVSIPPSRTHGTHPQLTNRGPATAGPAHLHPAAPSSQWLVARRTPCLTDGLIVSDSGLWRGVYNVTPFQKSLITHAHHLSWRVLDATCKRASSTQETHSCVRLNLRRGFDRALFSKLFVDNLREVT
jgi:hypothetical protein